MKLRYKFWRCTDQSDTTDKGNKLSSYSPKNSARYLLIESGVESCLVWVILKNEKFPWEKPVKVNYLEVAKPANR